MGILGEMGVMGLIGPMGGWDLAMIANLGGGDEKGVARGAAPGVGWVGGCYFFRTLCPPMM